MIQIIKYDKTKNAEVLGCVREVREELGWTPITPKFASDLLDIPGTYFVNKGYFWILVDGEKVIGTCGIKDMGRARGLLKRLYLDKQYRGQKLGKKLFDNAVSYAKENGFKTIYLGTGHAAETAVKMYDKLGLTRIEAYPEDFGVYGDQIFYKFELGN